MSLSTLHVAWLLLVVACCCGLGWFASRPYRLRPLLDVRGVERPAAVSAPLGAVFAIVVGGVIGLMDPVLAPITAFLTFTAVTDAFERLIVARVCTVFALLGAATGVVFRVEVDWATVALFMTLAVCQLVLVVLGASPGAGDVRFLVALAVLAAFVPAGWALLAAAFGLVLLLMWQVASRALRAASGAPLATAFALGFAVVGVLSQAPPA